MKETLVSFKVAKLLKEKGFDLECTYNYCIESYTFPTGLEAVKGNIYEFRLGISRNACAPTHSLAQKWLREVHGIHIRIDFTPNNNTYLYMVYKTGMDKVNWELRCLNEFVPFYNTYEEALEKGLIESLQSLK